MVASPYPCLRWVRGCVMSAFRCSLLVILAGFASACGADCEDATRFDGVWSVSSHVSSANWQVSGFNVDAADTADAQAAENDQADLLAQLFVNGTEDWTLARDGTSKAARLTISGQSYDARLTEDEDACNSFKLTFQGTWNGNEGSLHTFKYDGTVTFLGDEMTGAWSYTDNFTWEDRAAQGSVAIPAGVFRAVLPGADSGT